MNYLLEFMLDEECGAHRSFTGCLLVPGGREEFYFYRVPELSLCSALTVLNHDQRAVELMVGIALWHGRYRRLHSLDWASAERFIRKIECDLGSSGGPIPVMAQG